MAGNLIARSVHDLGAAVWFGGSLMGVVGLNTAAAHAQDPKERIRLAGSGWTRWTPVQHGGVVAHLVSGLILARKDRGRLARQHGVKRLTTYKTVVALTGSGVTFYTSWLGKRVDRLSQDAGGATDHSNGASAELRSAQRQLMVVQWLMPFFAGWVIVLDAKEGEMQRPANVIKGLARSGSTGLLKKHKR